MYVNNPIPRTIRICFAVVAVIAAIGALLWSRQIPEEDRPGTLSEDAYVLFSGSNPCYAVSDNAFAEASSLGLQLFNRDGISVVGKVTPTKAPACDVSDSLGIFYSVGDAFLHLAYPDGSMKTLELEEDIRFADVNKNGQLVVLTNREGYKGSVTVYDMQLNPLFQWDAGADQPVCARLSPKGLLAIGCLTEEGSRFLVFRTDHEEPLYQRKADDEQILDLAFLSEDCVAVLTDSGLLIQDLDRGAVGNLDNVGYPAFFETAENMAVLVSTPERFGGRGTVNALSDKGDLLGTLHCSGEILDLSVSKQHVLLLTAEELILCTRQLESLESQPVTPGTEYAFLRSDGTVLTVGTNGVECYDFGS